jgi:hypothetical protein
MYRFIKDKIIKAPTRRNAPKTICVEMPDNTENEIIKALRALNLSEDEINDSLRSSILNIKN